MTIRIARSRTWVAWPVALTIALAGCQASATPTPPASGAPSPSPSAPPSAGSSPSAGASASAPASLDPGDVDRTAERIRATDPADARTIEAVQDLRFTRLGVAAAAQVLEASDDPGALWAALWIYSTGGSDPKPLRRLAEHPDPTLASLAGAELVALGDAAGFTALRRAVVDAGWMDGAHPPLRTADYAARTLARSIAAVDPAAGLPDRSLQAAAYAMAWAAWLDEHAAALAFDGVSATWSIP